MRGRVIGVDGLANARRPGIEGLKKPRGPDRRRVEMSSGDCGERVLFIEASEEKPEMQIVGRTENPHVDAPSAAKRS